MSNNKIFIVIPAANDHMIIETINRMICQASKPENLSLVFSTEYSEGVFEEMFGVPQENAIELIDSRIGKVRHVIIEPKFINGPGSTRHYLCKMKEDESYFLSIDAHTSFGKNWDLNLINLYEESKKITLKPILTGLLQVAISDKTIRKDNDRRLRDRSVCMLYNSESGEHLSESWHYRQYKRISLYPGIINFEIASKEKLTYRVSKILSVDINGKQFRYNSKPIICAQFMFVDAKWIDEVNFSNLHTFMYEEPDISLRSYLLNYDMLNFEVQYLSNMSVHSESKDRSFRRYSEDYGYISFANLFLSTNIHQDQRSVKTWLQDTGIFFFEKNKDDTELKLDIKKIIDR